MLCRATNVFLKNATVFSNNNSYQTACGCDKFDDISSLSLVAFKENLKAGNYLTASTPVTNILDLVIIENWIKDFLQFCQCLIDIREIFCSICRYTTFDAELIIRLLYLYVVTIVQLLLRLV